MKKWNFGIVGAGLIADFHARALADIPRAQLIGCCDGGSGRARALAEKYTLKPFADYQEMIRDPQIDVVAIASPSGFHMAPAVLAAQQGKHVICEKPLEITLERVDAMLDAHRQAQTRLGGIFQNRYTQAIIPLRRAIAERRFGVITHVGVYVPWWRNEEYYAGNWHGTWNLDGGGALMNQSIHMIDMLIDLAGPVESVQAYVGALGHEDIETEDTAVAILRMAGGALGSIYGTTASYPGQLKRFEITGTHGTAIYLEDSLPVWQFSESRPEDDQIRQQFGKVKGAGGAADPASISHQNHTRNFEAFIDALEKNGDFEIDGAEARKSVELILAIYQSAREQRLVKF